MPTVTLHRGQDGKLAGHTDKDARAYAKFRKRIETLGPRETLSLKWTEPRSGAFHGRHFAMLDVVYQAQEQFADPDQFRKWAEVGAGHCDFVPGPNGRMVALPRSINFETLDQAEFEPIHEAVFTFLRSEHACRFLWPHLTDGADMVGTILAEFE